MVLLFAFFLSSIRFISFHLYIRHIYIELLSYALLQGQRRFKEAVQSRGQQQVRESWSDPLSQSKSKQMDEGVILRRRCESRSSRRSRRRRIPFFLTAFCVLVSLLLGVGVKGDGGSASSSQKGSGGPNKSKAAKKQKPVVALGPQELLDHVEYWTSDVAVFFYAPWCPYCK